MTYLYDGDTDEQQHQRNPLDSGQRLPQHQHTEQSCGEDLQLVGHLRGERLMLSGQFIRYTCPVIKAVNVSVLFEKYFLLVSVSRTKPTLVFASKPHINTEHMKAAAVTSTLTTGESYTIVTV